MNLTVRDVERTWVDVPFREVARRNMIRELPHFSVFEICRVTLECGVTGVGETMCFYTLDEVTDETVRRAMGRSAAELLWDDSLGAGLQMALFDAVAKANDVPIHRLLRPQVRREVPVSWWAVDMNLDDWLSECREALSRGHISFKYKARPWWDLRAQLRQVTAETPDYPEIDLDFNTMCGDAAHAVRILADLERFSQVKIFESPIPQRDVAGNKYLREHVNVPIAMHVGNPPLATALMENVCDGFVVAGGATRTLQETCVIAEHDKVCFLQHTGTGLAAIWSAHFGAVSTHARWPAVNCDTLFEHNLLKDPLPVTNGLLPVPEAPGLGVQLDEDAIQRYRIEPIRKPYPHQGLLIRISWENGAEDYYAHGRQYWYDYWEPRRPLFVPGVKMDLIPDDGSDSWQRLYQEALKKPEWVTQQN